MEAAKDQTTRTYRGNCHCGALVFELDLPEITTALECNCSICRKKGYLFVFPPGGVDDLRIVRGAVEDLASYTFGPKRRLHRFCSDCGTPVMAQDPEAPAGKQMALNVRTLQGLDIWSLKTTEFDGASMGEEYVPVEYRGPPPPEPGPGEKQYTTTCHCGRVGVAVTSPPIDETLTGRTGECNCSVCVRHGYYWLYSPIGTVAFGGDEAAIGRYSFGRHMMYKIYCKTCGVCLTNERAANWAENAEELRRAFTAQDVEKFGAYGKMAENAQPVNLRVFPDVDLSVLQPPLRLDGAVLIKSPYEDP